MISTGEQIGRYKIRSVIGKGGMGEVWLAYDTELERPIALKILPQDFANDAERMRRFVQEAKSASALNHPNIITIYEIGKTDSTHFIATEYIEGETLHSRLRSEPMNLKSILDIAIQVASALDAAHRAGIVHRDIKPENVMIRPDGVVKILDFGIAKLTEKNVTAIDAEAATTIKAEGTSPGMIIGTASYMSPEQAKGKPVDARSDIFSLGVVLYEMLAGRQPFEGENALDVIGSILNKEPVPIQQVIPEVPQEIGRISSKTLKKDREERYQTAKDLLIDLKDVKQDLEIQNKLERTAAPNREESKTQILNATTSDVAHTTSSVEYVVSEIKSHKSGFVIGLMVLLLASIGLGYWFFSNRTTSAAQIESIAVMPFANESSNADIEYLSDGMTETLISSLSQLPNLLVKARSSVFRYKGKDTDPQQIGKELNVQSVLNGRVVQRGQDLTLYIELVDAATEKVLWSENYNRKQADLVSLQSEIARDVANKLRTKLSGAEQNQIAKNYTNNTEAYQLYLQGRFYLNKRSPEAIRKATDYFKQTIAIDPNYALAYSGLSDAYNLLPIYDSSIMRRETMPQAKEAALKALSLNDELAEAHTSLAVVLSDHDKDWNAAEQHYRRAIELNPNYATAHQWYGETLYRQGRFEEGLAEIRRALELDPFSLITNMVLGMCLNAARRYDDAIVQLQKTLELDPNFPDTNGFLYEAYANKKMYAEAVAAFTKQMALNGESEAQIAATKEAFAKNGWEGFLRHRLNYELSNPIGAWKTNIAALYARLGDRDKAFTWLEKAYEEEEEGLTLLKVEPRFDNLRGDPRFQDLLRRVGLMP